MYFKNRIGILILLIFFMVSGYLSASTAKASELGASARFTNVHEASESNQIFSITPDFRLVAENQYLALYLNEASLAIRIENKQTGYIWSSDITDFGEDTVNETWRAFIQSGITIEVGAASGWRIEPRVTEESFLLSGRSTAQIRDIEDGFEAAVVFGTSGIGLTFSVILTENFLDIRLNADSITETETNKLISVQLFPFLGAARYGSQQGYFVIPDGDGALINFARRHQNVNTSYSSRFYGADFGVTPLGSGSGMMLGAAMGRGFLAFPMYGVVHGVRDNAFYAEILNGAMYAELSMYPAGVRTNFYFITMRYLFRQHFSHVVSADHNVTLFTPELFMFDIKERLHFLSGDEADYSGIAGHYRNQLIERGHLVAQNESRESIPLSLEVIASATNQGIFRNHAVIMTTLEDVKEMVADLNSAGVENIHVSYMFAFQTTLTGSERGRHRLLRGLGGQSGLEELLDSFQGTNNSFAFLMSYDDIASRFAGVDLREDVIRRINRQYAIFTNRFGAVRFRDYILNARGVQKVMAADVAQFREMGLTAISTLISTGASSYNEETITREQSFAMKTEALRAAKEAGMNLYIDWPSMIPVYFFPYLTGVRHVPMRTSLYTYVTDTIPFTPLVLRGSIDMFTNNLNTSGNPEEEMLRMIEWGIYPQFVVSEQPNSRMMYSNRTMFVSSRYTDWRERIIDTYTKVNSALAAVTGVDMIRHEAKADGVKASHYANGVTIYVNYTRQDFVTDSGVIVPARGYRVHQGTD